MPELPEVETIRRGLTQFLPGRRISGFKVLDLRALQGFSPSGAPRRRVTAEGTSSQLIGKTIEGILRRGKYLIFTLSSGEAFLCHLRMTGQLILGAPLSNARVQIGFDGTDKVLNFCDTRRFGEIWLAKDWRQDPSIRALGPEPLEDGWDQGVWGRSLRESRAQVQAALLDQKRLAGLGNIYVTEALFLSGIRPSRRCHTLKASQIPALALHIRQVLSKGLKQRGVSFYSYRDAEGNKGDAQKHLFAYGRDGEPCRNCETVLKGTKVGGRGTVYCPRCQK